MARRQKPDPTALQGDSSWRGRLASYAEVVSGGAWRPYSWLVDLCRKLQHEITTGTHHIIVNAPPRHGKSFVTSYWLPTWWLDNLPSEEVVVACCEANAAQDWSFKVRQEFETNPLTTTRVNPDRRKIEEWMTTKGGRMRAVGVGGTVIGKGANGFVGNDLIKSWAEATSPTQRTKLMDWLLSTAINRLEPDGWIVLDGHRWHRQDFMGELSRQNPGKWTVLSYPAINDQGEALCPERYPLDELVERRTLIGPFKWGALFQQRPEHLSGHMFDTAKVKLFQHAKLPKDGFTVASWDLSGADPYGLSTEDIDSGSFVAGGVFRVVGQDVYLIHVERERLSFLNSLDRIKAVYDRFHPAVTVIENKANGKGALKASFDSIPGLVKFDPQGSKEERAIVLQMAVELGHFHVLGTDETGSTPEWLDTYLDELGLFPAGSANDQVDMSSQVLLWMANKPESGLEEMSDLAINQNRLEALSESIQQYRLVEGWVPSSAEVVVVLGYWDQNLKTCYLWDTKRFPSATSRFSSQLGARAPAVRVLDRDSRTRGTPEHALRSRLMAQFTNVRTAKHEGEASHWFAVARTTGTVKAHPQLLAALSTDEAVRKAASLVVAECVS